MNINQFTKKSMEAVNKCVDTANEFGHQELVPAQWMNAL